MRQIIIQFGGTGDLFRKKLLPAYSNLLEAGYSFDVIALGRRYERQEEFLSELPEKPSDLMVRHLSYLQYDMQEKTAPTTLAKLLSSRIGSECSVELIYYLALQPSLYEPAIAQITQIQGLITCEVKQKIVVEKPFGFDTSSARRYHEILTSAFEDEEIYRVDHYLGKEFMHNILIMRFANDIIRGLWNKHYIDNIQIIFDEQFGVDQRLGFYERIGVVRDTVQNHILQIITHLTMSEPLEFTPQEISHEKLRVLKAIRPAETFYLSRYSSLAEQQTKGITTSTYAALKLYVDTFDFAGVPIYIRTGKMQKSSRSQIFINFKNSTSRVLGSNRIEENSLIITTHPQMDIDIMMNMKQPNTRWDTKPVKFNFNHAKTFGINTPEAYEQIVGKILTSDMSLFPSIGEITEAWRIVEPMLSGNVIETYEDHTLPECANTLIEKDGRSWKA